MKAFTTLVSAAALAVTVAAAAMPAHASVFAQFSPNAGSADYKWVKSASGTGGEFFSINASSDTTAQQVSATFSFLGPDAPGALALLPVLFNVDATAASGNAATYNAGAGTYTQAALNGSFHITYNGAATTIGGFSLVPGENLLSGTFTNAWIQGAGGSGSTNVTIGNGGSATYNSDIVNFANVVAGSEEFAFNLLAVSPHFGVSGGPGSCTLGTNHNTCTRALTGFTANGGGNFAANGVPEPATWALMILGFGGVGALLRNNRRRYATA